ncbi:MAG: hypothetical protein K2L78_01580, partial [Muribaculaceae bacterium]|nr:hypothetical protein [Muribaculaceae bacterium]
LASQLCGRNGLIVAGFNPPSAKISKAIGILSSLPNVAVMAEGLANLHCKGPILPTPDTLTSALQHHTAPSGIAAELRPDVLLTFGGSLVSASLKRFLRAASPSQHWHIGRNEATIDCFMSLTKRVEISPEGFLPKLATSLLHLTRTGENSGDYASLWSNFAKHACKPTAVGHDCWNARSAVGMILEAATPSWNLQLSNGMSVRYALDFPLGKFHRADCNRGVSGIDGSVSTAVGAAAVYDKPTLLITGDMSMQYDIAALSSNLVTDRLKIVVLNNGGGGIFKYVDTTAQLPETPQLIHCSLNLPIETLAKAYGFRHIKA